MATPSLYVRIVQPLRQFHESLRLPVAIPLLSKFFMPLTYLAICSVFPNAFGWTLALLCVISPSSQALLLEAWKHKDGVLLFNTCCWEFQAIFDLLFGAIYGGISLILWPLSRIFRLRIDTLWTVLAFAVPIYCLAVLCCMIYDAFDNILATSVFRVGIVALLVILVAVFAYRLAAKNQIVQ